MNHISSKRRITTRNIAVIVTMIALFIIVMQMQQRQPVEIIRPESINIDLAGVHYTASLDSRVYCHGESLRMVFNAVGHKQLAQKCTVRFRILDSNMNEIAVSKHSIQLAPSMIFKAVFEGPMEVYCKKEGRYYISVGDDQQNKFILIGFTYIMGKH